MNKKIPLIFCIVGFFLLSYDVNEASASEYDYRQGYYDENPSQIGSSIPPVMYDNDLNTYATVGVNRVGNYLNLGEIPNGHSFAAIYVKANFLTGTGGFKIVYKDGKSTVITLNSGENIIYATSLSQPSSNIQSMHISEGEEYPDGSTAEIYEIELFTVKDSLEDVRNVVSVINEDDSVTYQYDLPNSSVFSHLEIYQDEQLIKNDYKLSEITITGLNSGKTYNFKFVTVGLDGSKTTGYISTIDVPVGPDLIAPLDVTEIKQVVSGTGIQFTYNLPIDDDFSHIQVWRDNVMIADNVKINSFNDTGLEYEQTYNYVFKSVDFSGNVSNGSSLTVKTMPEIDEIAPLSPVGVDVVNGNASLFLSWSASPENDVAGYNVYVDGVKRNGSPVAGNSFRMTNLVNGQEYSLQVSAVDTSGNESELTQTFVGVPDSAMLPVFKVDTDLSAVAKSTENWFSQLWLVTAFSASIPIAFFVGGRVKALFFA